MAKSILITGATGFIGRHLVLQALKEGNDVHITLLDGEKSPFPEKVKIIDLCKDNLAKTVDDFLKNDIKGVIHLASFVQSGHHEINEVSKMIHSNILFGVQILECAARSNSDWFINTGTYWQNYQNADYSPVNLYASTKQAFEDIARYYVETNRIKFYTIRLFDTYGEGDTRPKIFNLWNRIAETGETLDMSLGEQIVDISHVDDIVNAYIILMNSLESNNQTEANGSVYFVKAKDRYSLRELAEIFEEVNGKKLRINWGAKPYRENEVMLPYEGGIVVPGWTPKVDLREGIKRYLRHD